VRTKPCSATIAQGRLNKANQFITAADMIRDLADEDEEVADAYVTLCVHAGIAASDVICCSNLGKHAQGESHDEATTLLASVDKDVAKHLRAFAQAEDEGGLRPQSAADSRATRRFTRPCPVAQSSGTPTVAHRTGWAGGASGHGFQSIVVAAVARACPQPARVIAAADASSAAPIFRTNTPPSTNGPRLAVGRTEHGPSGLISGKDHGCIKIIDRWRWRHSSRAGTPRNRRDRLPCPLR